MATPESTETRILDAALELFSELGYAGTTTRAIAHKAGVNEVTLFRRFGSKRNIFIGSIKREVDATQELEEFKFELTEDLEGDMTRLGMRITDAMTAHAKLVKIIMVEAAKDPSVWEHISGTPLGVLEKLTGVFEHAQAKGLVRDDLDAHTVAVSFFSFFFRTLVTNAFLGRDIFIEMDEVTIRKFANIFTGGISNDR